MITRGRSKQKKAIELDMSQGWEWHIAYIVVYIDRVNTVVVQKTSQHFLSKKFSKEKKKKKKGARLYDIRVL